MSLHALLGKHTADLKVSRWDQGRFISRCTACGASMIKPPGLPWQLDRSLSQ